MMMMIRSYDFFTYFTFKDSYSITSNTTASKSVSKDICVEQETLKKKKKYKIIENVQI